MLFHKETFHFLHLTLFFSKFAKGMSKQYSNNKCCNLLCVNDMLDTMPVAPRTLTLVMENHIRE